MVSFNDRSRGPSPNGQTDSSSDEDGGLYLKIQLLVYIHVLIFSLQKFSTISFFFYQTIA